MGFNKVDINYNERLNVGTKAIDYEYSETEKNSKGEVVNFKKTESKKIPKEDNYIKLYLTDITKLFDLPDGLAKLAVTLSSYMTYEGIVYLNSTLKKTIAIELKYKNDRTVNNNLAKLVQAAVLIKNDTGTYEFNPFIIAKGKWKDIYSKRKEWVGKINVTYKNNERIVVTDEGELKLNKIKKGELNE